MPGCSGSVALRAACALTLLAGASARAQAPARLAVEAGPFYHSLDNGYGWWRGADVRLWYTGTRASPFFSASLQERREGRQASYGVGSYVTLSRRTYSIVGMSVAPKGTTTLYPRLRLDASLLTAVPSVRGLVLAGGITYVRSGASEIAAASTGQILSVGPILYRGRAILSGTARLNRDGASGDLSGSGQVGGQFGAQGRQWVGGGVSWGREAYQLLTATPFDVRFTSVGANAFAQRWVTARTALGARYDFEHKLTAYRRHGLSLTYRVEF